VTTREAQRPTPWLAAALVVAILVASRLLFIPGVPWEQDEALFGAASFDTELRENRPHPPGFPLWVAIGKLGLALGSDPVAALQLVSALASLLTAWLLARLWSAAFQSRSLGVASALLFAFAPAVLFFAPRALSTTPALCLAVVALEVWTRPGRPALTGGAVALGCALLVRPILAPPALVVGLAAMALRRERLRGVVLAATVVAVTLALGLAPLVWDSGGPASYLGLVLNQAGEHAGALGLAAWRPRDLGVVRAVGGSAAALAVAILAVVGWVRLVRRRPRLAWWWLAVTVATAGWLLLAHNRAMPRYAPPLLALLSGPVVYGCWTGLRSQRLAVAVAALGAAASAAWTAPALVALATEDFPPLAALGQAQSTGGGRAVIVDGALSPFTDYLMLARRGQRPCFWRPLLAQGRVPWAQVHGPWTYIWCEGSAAVWIPSPGRPRIEHSCSGPRIRVLAGSRYLKAWRTEQGGIVVAPTEPRLDSEGSAWLDQELTVLLQPAPRGSWLGAVLEVDEAIEIGLSGGRQGPRSTRLEPGLQHAHVPLDQAGGDAATRPTLVTLSRRGGGRALLRRIWIEPPDGRFTPPVMTPEAQAAGMDGLVEGSGFHGVERLAPGSSGRWTGSRARLSVPAGGGRLVVRLSAPRPQPARVRLSTGAPGWSQELVVGAEWVEVSVPTFARGRLELSVEVANPFIPAESIPGSQDRRELGVFVGELRFRPGS